MRGRSLASGRPFYPPGGARLGAGPLGWRRAGSRERRVEHPVPGEQRPHPAIKAVIFTAVKAVRRGGEGAPRRAVDESCTDGPRSAVFNLIRAIVFVL